MRLTAILTSLFLALSVCAVGQSTASKSGRTKNSKQILREEDPSFFKTDKAVRIGDQVLLWQRDTGGWPKNIDMVSPMTDEEKAKVAAEKSRRDDSTTDNDATNMQLVYLARLYDATGEPRFRDGFNKGVEYLLSGQYDNGGWPQFWPDPTGYQPHITYNDDAMVNTMNLLRDIYEGETPFSGDLCDEKVKERARTAFDKGVECILATQIVSDGVPTVWCQQHDHETLAPAHARTYELPSYCSQESAAIVRLLMSLPEPDSRVKTAVHSAMAWFDRHKLTGMTYRRALVNGKWEAELINDPDNPNPLWARFYDLDKCLPFVCDRDGIPKRNLDEIGSERRNGYSWYNERPAALYDLYEEWADRYDLENKVSLVK